MTVGSFFFPCFEKHEDSRTSAALYHLVNKPHFELKFSSEDPLLESRFESEEVAYSKKNSHCNEVASYFESNSTLSKIELFSLGDSNSSD